MLRRLLQRVVSLILVVFVTTFATFLLVNVLPGDPTAAILGPNHPASEYAQLRNELGLNEPVMSRYASWLSGAVRGDLGTSLVPPELPVSTMVFRALPISLELAFLGLLIALALSIPLALRSARSPDGMFDRLTTSITFGMVALPSFVIGLLLILILVVAIPAFPRTHWVRLTSPGGLAGNLHAALLPALVVAIPEIPQFLRVLRGDLVATVRSQFVVAARSRGVSERRLMYRHVLRPSLLSLLTLSGVSFGRLVGSTVIAEYLFDLPGVGSLIVTSAETKDLPTLLGAVMVISVIYVVANLVVDVTSEFVDPRLQAASMVTGNRS